jgi:hypothetical protein
MSVVSTGIISAGETNQKNNNICARINVIINGGEHEKGSHSNKL